MSSDNPRRRCCSFFTFSLKEKCYYIGYINLIAAILDLALHLFVLGMSSNGFQCDMNDTKLNVMEYPWVGTLFFMINLGTHGFYTFPVIFGSEHGPLDYTPTEMKCYPGMLHIYLIDILYVLINFIWLRFVISYVKALYKKDPEPMRVFFNIYLLKWIIQLIYVSFTPNMQTANLPSFLLIRSLDFFVAFVFLFLIRKYTLVLRATIAIEANNPDRPPSYFECLMYSLSQNANQKKEKEDEKKETDVVIPVEDKTELVRTGNDVPKTVV